MFTVWIALEFYFNCIIYGHISSECRKPNKKSNVRMSERTNNVASRLLGMNNIITNGVICNKCNNFGHIVSDCRLQINQFRSRYVNGVVSCHFCNNLGYTSRF